ncbi:hypothetical protein J7337_011183 [Fusarium musae]|uniref:Uncharacterized protein n=1 Tax=Fusarium musae TaxID=1042133 RepID=A0A9P8DAA8_9HYPO|nr:hypothetical protein J7337_011183 [Fusarium musae]KAG9498287.1 hypothetical protein J7337_011183 [Fusarium musae]
MGTKGRGSELDHEAKRIKSDDGKGGDEVSSSNCVQTAPALPRQPITHLSKLSQVARQQIDYLLQALSEIYPESLHQVDILDQINAINADRRRPIFPYKPPKMVMTICRGPREIDVTQNSEKIGGGRLISLISAVPYGDECYFTVEIEHPRLYMGEFAMPCEDDWESKYEEMPWKDDYLRQVKRLARNAVFSHNRNVLGWAMREIAHAETPLACFNGIEKVRGQFLSGNVVWTTESRDAWGFHG